MLTLENITYKKRGQTLLSQINGEINRGDCVTLFGPNGAGKSTLIKIMAGLVKPSKGKRSIQPEHKNPIGYVPQQTALFKGLTVRDQIKYYQKLTKPKSNEFIDDMILSLGLSQILNKRIEQLSGGMKRKVNLAVGMVHQPELLLLDEAFVGVDLAAKHDMLTWLRKLNNQGTTIVFITHDWYVIQHLQPTMWVLDHGVMIDQVEWDSVPYLNLNRQSQALQKMFDVNMGSVR
ncbi:ABC transporter ATP-binding protein [Piscibacillus halophilus]|uniref:ABC-2 type transport system ATP-binding protein n=3 Tax=Piscibacillus halophilus TaxID=571933 RepID=A0A1H9AQX4_9BACI|nr:ABC transporter ATP-binding protein [Piscibacillus halophilus]SEP78773.1 ABC-2 type transport system ATP-binding protein [Piscibacillus halophilus]